MDCHSFAFVSHQSRMRGYGGFLKCVCAIAEVGSKGGLPYTVYIQYECVEYIRTDSKEVCDEIEFSQHICSCEPDQDEICRLNLAIYRWILNPGRIRPEGDVGL
jgi:hypothetical protein